jgi:hypothetical protein
MLLYPGQLGGHQCIEHSAQVPRRLLNIGALVFPCTGFGDEHRAAMDVLEIAERKPVTTFAVLGFLIVLPEMPSSKFDEAAGFDEFGCRAAGRLVVRPVAWLIEYASAILDQLLRVLIGAPVQPQGHRTFLARFELQGRCSGISGRVGPPHP